MITITYHSSPTCGWCTKWTREEKQYLNPAYEFDEVQGGAESYPTFKLDVNGNKMTLVGFKEIYEIEAAIEKLRNVPS